MNEPMIEIIEPVEFPHPELIGSGIIPIKEVSREEVEKLYGTTNDR